MKSPGQVEKLVADARRRIHLDKTALLGATFEPALNDEASRTRFANWVAGRYNRPAIPNDLVDAIQKPIVSAVDGLVKKDDPLSRVFNRVVEIRFAIASAKPPWTVHLVMMIDEGDELTAADLVHGFQQLSLFGWGEVDWLLRRWRQDHHVRPLGDELGG